MKHIIKLFFVSFFIFFISCGQDNITNNNNGNPPASNDSLLFSKDSISINLPTGGFGNESITYTKTDTALFPVRIVFTAEGYNPGFSTNGVRYIVTEPLDEFCNPKQLDSAFQNLQTPFSYNYNYVNYSTCRDIQVNINILAGGGNNTVPCWIRIKNIKIYRSKP